MPDAQLPSWNDGATRRAIGDFLARVTAVGRPDFVAPAERVAVFDNDGTLWCEKPLPVQADFLLRAAGRMAERDPALRARQPWKAVAEHDYDWLGAVIDKHYAGDDSDLRVMAAGLLQAYAGSSIEEFEAAAAAFLRTAQHPAFQRPYRECAYQPMLELLALLEANGFTSYVVTGGGRDFLRPATEDLYHVPPERVIGSSAALEYLDGGPVASIIHRPALGIFDDGAAKPVQIWDRIGRRPIFAAGNSNGDIAMLRFCAHPARPSFGLLLAHDDGAREYAYTAGAEEARSRAAKEGWTVASLKNDWNTVFSAPPT
jgi:phosphoglycolate phosphatase-like HAD superfamily hydrolase